MTITDEGQLIGHIVIGVEMVDEAIRSIPDFPVRLANELKHCIIAHHGELEYGSPKKPALAEAMALNLADNADAKMQTLTEIFKGKTGTEWLGYNKLFESNLRRTIGSITCRKMIRQLSRSRISVWRRRDRKA